MSAAYIVNLSLSKFLRASGRPHIATLKRNGERMEPCGMFLLPNRSVGDSMCWNIKLSILIDKTSLM